LTLVEHRLGILFGVFLAALGAAALKAGHMGVIQGGGLSSAATSQQQTTQEILPRRGAIVDRSGVALATSEPADDISATPYLVKNPVRAAEKLAPVLGLDEAEVIKKLSVRGGGAGSGFAYLARRVPPSVADDVKRLKLDGIDVTAGSRRTYPHGMLAAQVLGTVNLDGKGLFGLEFANNEELRGTQGKRVSVYNGERRAIEIRDVRTAVPGVTMRLTLDAEIQDRTEEVLEQVGRDFSPKGATAIVMDPTDGSVLAMANWPRIDANDLSRTPAAALQNRAVGYSYEPGSTFKAITVAAALEEGEVEPGTRFNLPPTIRLYDRVIGESHPRGWETMDTREILAHSSNVGAIKIGQRLGAKRFDRWVRRFGFGTPTGIALPGEEQGLALDLDDYSGSSMGNLPIGHGELVTPIQLAAAYSAIANGGILRTPRLIDAVGGEQVETTKARRVISSRTAFEVRTMLKGVFAPGGTASEVSIPGYELAGKTGTANKLDPRTGEYSEENYVASFVGFAPAEKPKLLVSVMVDEPRGAIYGGEVAAPAFGKIASFALPYLRIAPE
jgi:cell division protein FtsI/penicillin-binding protein 2